MLSDIMKQVKTNFESFIVIGVLIIAISLIGSSLPGLPLMLEVHWDNVFAQASNDATTNLQFSYTKLGVLSGGYQRISYNSETKTLRIKQYFIIINHYRNRKNIIIPADFSIPIK